MLQSKCSIRMEHPMRLLSVKVFTWFVMTGACCQRNWEMSALLNPVWRVQEDMRNGQVALEKYIITKMLTKQPEAYPDAKNQSHVLVALRLKQSGYTVGCLVGDKYHT